MTPEQIGPSDVEGLVEQAEKLLVHATGSRGYRELGMWAERFGPLLIFALRALAAERDEAVRLRADAELEVQLLAKGLKAEQSRLLKAVEGLREIEGRSVVDSYLDPMWAQLKARSLLRSIEEASDGVPEPSRSKTGEAE